MMLKRWQQRVVDEKLELDASLVKLVDFINKEEVKWSCDSKEDPDDNIDLNILWKQRKAMARLSGILNERIVMFGCKEL